MDTASSVMLPQQFKVIPLSLWNAAILDLSALNPELQRIDTSDVGRFSSYIAAKREAAGAEVAIGKYNEDRCIYTSKLFSSKAGSREISLEGSKKISSAGSALISSSGERTIHLGIDLWCAAGTPVLAPFAGSVHSFQDNKGEGDYGPTIILEHEVKGAKLFTLYGHLSASSLEGLHVGKQFAAGRQIATVGNYPQNGNWPPHLHFQIIKDMLGRKGDFPGVCARKDRSAFLEICPDPSGVVGLNH